MLDSRHFIIRTLLADGLIKEPDVRRATERAVGSGGDVLDAMVSLGIVSSRRLAIARAKICEYPFFDIGQFEIDIRNSRLIPRAVAERLVAFPLFMLGDVATVAMLDPLNLQAIDQLRQLLKCDVDPVIADAEQLRALIARAYSLVGADAGSSDGPVNSADVGMVTGQEPIVAAVNQIIHGAIEAGASDVHINPDENELLIRYRVDGSLLVVQGPQRAVHEGLVQRLKVLARLDLTQTRKPQDGKFRFVYRDHAVDVRLSVVPTIHGENVVMRLLRAGAQLGPIESLGMPDAVGRDYAQLVRRPHGMILVTGPTGSGKTTTLYTALAAINTPDRNIITIEDPVEIRLPMIRQVQVNHEIGLSFASTLRSVLRQDPDVVLVGEIRDQDTAKIAVQAALTGPLVFSTLHTNDAVGSLARLRDFGVPSFAINNALLCVIAQRLVRRLCAACCIPEVDSSLFETLPPQFRSGTYKAPQGCSACKSTGYKGRVGVYEMLRVTRRIQAAIEADANRDVIERIATEEGMQPMLMDGLTKASRGLTSLAETARLRPVADEDPQPSTADSPASKQQVDPAGRIAA